MDPGTRPSDSVALAGDDLAQIVPSEICLRCDVCCRFPERESFLRPYFTARERERALAAGLSPSLLPAPGGGRVELVPHPQGDGFICPAFDPTTQHCTIYAVRPLDCRLYPLALMWNEEGSARLLGLDTKCPYVQDAANDARLLEYARRAGERLREAPLASVLEDNSELTNRFQDDVRPIFKVSDGPQ